MQDNEAYPANQVPETYLRDARHVRVYEDDGKRFAVAGAATEGFHIVDITDVNDIKPMPQPYSASTLGGGAEGIDTWVSSDGLRYFAGVWSASDALGIFKLHPTSGLLYASWNSGSRVYVQDAGRLDGAADVFVYRLQEKDYAVVVAATDGTTGGLYIYDVTDPAALCSCNSGAGLTALLTGSLVDTGSLKLEGAVDVKYYQQNDKHYALVASSTTGGVQIVDISDPSNPVARDSLSDNSSLLLKGASAAAVYGVDGRDYAVIAAFGDDGVQVVDITDPTNIVAAGKLADSSSLRLGGTQGVAVHSIGSRRYAIITAHSDDGVQIVDVTDPHNLIPKTDIGHKSGLLLEDAYGVDVFQDDDRHYMIVASEVPAGGLQILELTESEFSFNSKVRLYVNTSSDGVNFQTITSTNIEDFHIPCVAVTRVCTVNVNDADAEITHFRLLGTATSDVSLTIGTPTKPSSATVVFNAQPEIYLGTPSATFTLSTYPGSNVRSRDIALNAVVGEYGAAYGASFNYVVSVRYTSSHTVTTPTITRSTAPPRVNLVPSTPTPRPPKPTTTTTSAVSAAGVGGFVGVAACEVGGEVGVLPFVDVSLGSFAAADIGCVYALGVTRGVTSTMFEPEAGVSRAQMAAFLARLYRVYI